MPTYDFLCERDNEERGDVYLATIDSPNPECPTCHSPMERVYSLGARHVGSSSFPYVTKNLTNDGSPVEVRSEGHLRELCKKYNRVHRPDNGWIDKQWVGYDPVKKQQIYKEGSGRGMPGSWY